MKILMLGRWLPVARPAGTASREHRIARHLAQQHRLTLAFVTDDPEPFAALSTLREEFADLEFAVVPRGWKILSAAVRLASGESGTLAYHQSEALHTRLADRVRTDPFDLALVSSSRMIPYALNLPPATPLVMDFADVDSEWWFRQATLRPFPGARFYRTEGHRLRLAETEIARRASLSLVSAPASLQIVRSFAPAAAVQVVPHGVDLQHFPGTDPARRGSTVLLVAPMETESDVDAAARFCLGFLSSLRQRIPTAEVVVLGRSAHPAARRLARIPGVEVAAPGADIRPLLQRAVATLDPLAGPVAAPGTLEAMAAGVPVVTTPPVCESLGAVAGREVTAAEGPEGFAESAARLIQSPGLREHMAAQGSTYVRTSRSWDLVLDHLEATLETVLGAPRVTPPGADDGHGAR